MSREGRSGQLKPHAVCCGAVYTLCFLCGDEKQVVTFGPYRCEITCYKYNMSGRCVRGHNRP